MHFVVIDDNAAHRELMARRLGEVCAELSLDYDIPLSTEHSETVLTYAANASEGTVYIPNDHIQNHTA